MGGVGAAGVGRSKEVGRRLQWPRGERLVAPSEMGSGEPVTRGQMLDVSLR